MALSFASAVFASYGRAVPCAYSASIDPDSNDCVGCGAQDAYVIIYVDGVECARSNVIESYSPNWGSSCCDWKRSRTSVGARRTTTVSPMECTSPGTDSEILPS